MDRRPARLQAMGLCLAAVLAAPAPQQRVDDSYTVRGELVELSIHLDKIGLVRHDGKIQTDHPDELAPPASDGAASYEAVDLVPTPGPSSRDGLTDLVEDLCKNDPDVRHAGLLATHDGGDEPVLLTQEVIVRFHTGVPADARTKLAARYGLIEMHGSDYLPELFLYDIKEATAHGYDQMDAIEVVRLLNEEPEVDYAEPNFVHGIERTSLPQWHIRNQGEGGGTNDADIDAHRAWEMTRGSHDTIIAVLEDGFDVGHPDLAPNLWYDPATGTPGKSFFHCSNPQCDPAVDGETPDRGAIAHGTAVAGCAAAVENRAKGTSGTCPECALMPLRRSLQPFGDAQAFYFAAAHGASVISNSWKYKDGSHVPLTVRDAVHDARTVGRGGKGCVVLFSVENAEIDLDQLPDEICHLPGVITVGSIANTDQHVDRCGYGNCISVLGPSRYNRSSSDAIGTLNVATIDWRGEGNGYNADPKLAVKMMQGWAPCVESDASHDYTACFGGSSAATPIVAGVCGLILDANPNLTEEEVRLLLQDTADRADPQTAAYSPVNGYSTSRRCGNGRINAYEAVRIAAGSGVDLVVRDNGLDWGNTDVPSFLELGKQRGTIGHWQSPDIKVDAAPYADVGDGLAFESFEDEPLSAGAQHRIYVRLRNRGPKDSGPAEVALLWTVAGGATPRLPTDFWSQSLVEAAAPAPQGGAGSSPWTSLGILPVDNVPYSGPSIVAANHDPARIVTFDFEAPPANRSEATIIALLAAVDAASDPIAATSRASRVVDRIVPRDSNLALRAVELLPTTRQSGPALDVALTAVNATDAGIESYFELIAPAGATLRLEPTGRSRGAFAPITLAAGDTTVKGPPFRLSAGAPVAARIVGSSPAGTVELRQWNVGTEFDVLAGGSSLTVPPR